MNVEKIIKNIALILIIITFYAYIHEGTHVQIFRICECENIETDYFTKTTADCNNSAILPTAINEIVGYTVVPILCVIMFLLLSKRVERKE